MTHTIHANPINKKELESCQSVIRKYKCNYDIEKNQGIAIKIPIEKCDVIRRYFYYAGVHSNIIVTN